MLRGLDGYLPDTRLDQVNCAVLRARRAPVSQTFGGHSEGDTPLPIPNREVKPLSADGTWLARAWESRSPPINSHGPSLGAARSALGAFGSERLDSAGMSTIAIVLIVVGAVLLLLLFGGYV